MNSTKNKHFCRHFLIEKSFQNKQFTIPENFQVQYLTLVSNDFRSSLRRPRYSLFIRASLANPLFPCLCPIGFLGNLSINSKLSPTHPYFIVSSHPDLLAKYGDRWHLWKSKVAQIALVGARIHLQKGHLWSEIVRNTNFRRPIHREITSHLWLLSEDCLNPPH